MTTDTAIRTLHGYSAEKCQASNRIIVFNDDEPLFSLPGDSTNAQIDQAIATYEIGLKHGREEGKSSLRQELRTLLGAF